MKYLSVLAGATLLAAAGQANAASATYNITLQLGTDLDPGSLFAEGTTSNNTQGSWSGQYFNGLTASNAVPGSSCTLVGTVYDCTNLTSDPITQVSTIDFSGSLTLTDDANDVVTFSVAQDNASDRISTGVQPALGGTIARTLTNWNKTAVWDALAADPTLFGAVAAVSVDLGLGTVNADGGYSVDTGNQSCAGAPAISAICTSINGANSTRDQQWSSGLSSDGVTAATALFGIGTSPSGGNGLTDISCTITGSTITCAGHYTIVSSVEHTGASADVVIKTPLSGFCKTGNKKCTTTGSVTIGAFRIQGDLAPVPVPAAVWLFGSALGLLGVARRRFVA